MKPLRICVAGATGWAGSALSKGIYEADDMELVAAISRSHAGKALGDVIGIAGLASPIFASVEDALKTNPDVLVEYTKPDVAKHHVLAALLGGTHVVIGTSGLSNEDYDEIDRVALKLRIDALGIAEVQNRIALVAEARAGIDGREKAARPQCGATAQPAARAHHDECETERLEVCGEQQRDHDDRDDQPALKT